MEVPLPEEQVEAGTARLKDGARADHGCSGHVHLLLGEGAGAGGFGGGGVGNCLPSKEFQFKMVRGNSLAVQ